jgi:type III restriction enzyme
MSEDGIREGIITRDEVADLAFLFDRDPLVPVEWRGDWNLTTVLQDEAGGVSTGGTLYLTNIHRLFDNTRKRESGQTFDWMGPAVSKATVLDTAAALRDRITSHQSVMVMNDEAHHVWEPDSAWNEAIKFLHETIQKRTGGSLFAQLDFSATPKDNKANYFKHIVCDTPLGEAVGCRRQAQGPPLRRSRPQPQKNPRLQKRPLPAWPAPERPRLCPE